MGPAAYMSAVRLFILRVLQTYMVRADTYACLCRGVTFGAIGMVQSRIVRLLRPKSLSKNTFPYRRAQRNGCLLNADTVRRMC